MNDTMKGISILSVTAIAIFGVLNQDNQGFDIAFLAGIGAETEQSASLQLQQSILAGVDPTEIQEPSAAGVTERARGVDCYRGWISIDDDNMTLDQQAYISAANEKTMYVRIVDRKLIIEIPNNNKTLARRADNVPVEIAVELADVAVINKQCTRKDLIITAWK
jgi:hypothetical protein